jgi:hypothetical protein
MRNNDTIAIPLPCGGHIAAGDPVFATVPGIMLDADGKEWQACAVKRTCRRCGWLFSTGEQVLIRDGRVELASTATAH